MKREAPTEKSSSHWWRRLASLAIVIQLWAILGRPLEFATQGPTGTSPAARALYDPIKPYAEFTYLNHGYAFFAPNPGPSHLIRVTTEPSGGGKQESIYPDLSVQWPRLLYHRHFMLSEFLNNTFQPSEPPAEISQVDWLRARWELDRARYDAILDSMQSHLAVKAGVMKDSVVLHRLEHQLLGLPEFLEDPRRINEPSLMVDLTELEQQAFSASSPELPQMRWPGSGQSPPGDSVRPFSVPLNPSPVPPGATRGQRDGVIP